MMFATVDDLRLRWPDLPVPEDVDGEAGVAAVSQFEAKLSDASVWLQVTYPDIPVLADGEEFEEPLGSVLRMVVCRMVQRAVNTAGMEGFKRYSEDAGPFTGSIELFNSGGDNFYLTAQEKALIESALGRGRGAMSMEMVTW